MRFGVSVGRLVKPKDVVRSSVAESSVVVIIGGGFVTVLIGIAWVVVMFSVRVEVAVDVRKSDTVVVRLGSVSETEDNGVVVVVGLVVERLNNSVVVKIGEGIVKVDKFSSVVVRRSVKRTVVEVA